MRYFPKQVKRVLSSVNEQKWVEKLSKFPFFLKQLFWVEAILNETETRFL